MTHPEAQVVVLARGALDGEAAALAIRVALALPLAGLGVQLLLVDGASPLALATPLSIAAWAGSVDRELEALRLDEQVEVAVELESLRTLGLEDRELLAGVHVLSREQVLAVCGDAGQCLVL